MGFSSRECEFADIKVAILGKECTGLRGITYEQEQEKELVYGQGNQPKSIQRGNVKNSGTLTVLKSDLDELNLAARAAGFRNIMAVPGKFINVTIVYQKDDGDPVKTDILLCTEFTKMSDGMKQGDKFKEVEMPFLFLSLKQS